MKTFFLLMIGAAMACAQAGKSGDMEFVIVPFGIPCDESLQSKILGMPCPPAEEQGAMIHVRSEAANFDAFRITVVSLDGSGTRVTTQFSDRPVDGFATAAFRIGRLQTTDFTNGTVILTVTAEKVKKTGEVAAVFAPPVITIGETKWGPPPKNSSEAWRGVGTWGIPGDIVKVTIWGDSRDVADLVKIRSGSEKSTIVVR